MAWMFEKEMNLEDLNKYWKECAESKNIIQKNMPKRLYNMAKETYEREQKEDKILKSLEKDKGKRNVKNILIIDENSAIIETFENIFGPVEKTWYRTYYNGNIVGSVTTKLDIALLQLVAIKNGNEGALQWVMKMLDIEEVEDI